MNQNEYSSAFSIQKLALMAHLDRLDGQDVVGVPQRLATPSALFALGTKVTAGRTDPGLVFDP